MSTMPPKNTIRWLRFAMPTIALFCVLTPYVIFRARAYWAAERLVRDVNALLPKLDPPGSDDAFPECLQEALRSVPAKPNSACAEFERGTEPRAAMPAGCRAELDALGSWAERVLSCAKQNDARRSPFLAFKDAAAFDGFIDPVSRLFRGVRHGLTDARERGDHATAQRLCAQTIAFDERFLPANWLLTTSCLSAFLEGDCLWAADGPYGVDRDVLRASVLRAIDETPTLGEMLSMETVFWRCGSFGGYATEAQLQRVPPKLRWMMGLEWRDPDDFPRIRHTLNQWAWPTYDAAAIELVAAARKPTPTFEADARRIGDRIKSSMVSDLFRASWFEVGSLTKRWDQRADALRALERATSPTNPGLQPR